MNKGCVMVVSGALLAMLCPLAMAQNVDYGGTYLALDAASIGIEMEYPEVRVLTRRAPSGELTSVVQTAQGAEVGRIEIDARSEVLKLSFVGIPERELSLLGRAFETITLDWASVQAYEMWRSIVKSGVSALAGAFEWDGKLLRPLGTGSWLSRKVVGAPPGLLEHTPIRVRTDFGFVYALSQLSGGVDGGDLPTFTTGLFDSTTETQLGAAGVNTAHGWYVWNIPGVSEGLLSNDTVPGGWQFAHNMVWSNIQIFSLRSGARVVVPSSELRVGGQSFDYSSAPRVVPGAPTSPQLRRIFAANTVGCDGFHYLDNTVYRKCCDDHDLCFEKEDPDCTWKSWLFLEGWRCFSCNVQAIVCFATTLTGGGGGGGDDCCYRDVSGVCPAECYWCC